MTTDIEIISECKTAFAKAKQLIAERKKRFNRMPEIQEFDNGNILIQFFEHWDIDWGKLKKRDFKPVHQDNKTIVAVFAEAGKPIEVETNNKSKTYMIVNGEIQITAGENIQKLSTFQSISIPSDMTHTVQAVRDTYVIIIQE